MNKDKLTFFLDLTLKVAALTILFRLDMLMLLRAFLRERPLSVLEPPQVQVEPPLGPFLGLSLIFNSNGWNCFIEASREPIDHLSFTSQLNFFSPLVSRLEVDFPQ